MELKLAPPAVLAVGLFFAPTIAAAPMTSPEGSIAYPASRATHACLLMIDFKESMN
jgi:hypothetical protein